MRRKFDLTLTLPDHVIRALTALDPDLSRGVVRLAQPMLADAPERRTGIELLHLPDGRALISFDEATSIADLELTIKDALEDRRLPAADREIFAAIGDILKSARQSETVVLLKRNVIVLETRRAAASIPRNSK